MPVTLTATTGAPVVLPRGTLCVSPESAVHGDAAHYPAPHTFDPWRFSDLRDAADDEGADKTSGVKHQFVSTGRTYIPFGLGKHAW